MWRVLRGISLTKWIFICMALGVAIGALWPDFAINLRLLSNLFLRMIKCILVPLVFATLVSGIAKHGDDLKGVARLAFKSIVYFEIVTTLALFIGLIAVNLSKPGVGVKLPPPQANTVATTGATNAPITFSGTVEHIVPKSFFEAAANNDVLQVVFFAIVFGVALSQLQTTNKAILVGWMDAVMETMFKFTALIMNFAPIGIGAAMAYTVAHSGLPVLVNLAKLILTLYAALIVFCVAVFLPVMLWARIPVKAFIQAVREPALLAFATTSSEAAFPDAMKKMVALGAPTRIVSFVMPLGYSFNLDGSTLYLAVASMFVAQAAGVELSVGQQLLIMGTLMLTSKGMAGIPRASQVILAGTLVAFKLPIEGVLLIIGIDELMDMARTTVNLVGNCLAAVVMARLEKETVPNSPLALASRSVSEANG